MHLQLFETMNGKDGFGQESNQSMDDMSPLCWRTTEEQSEQHPTSERLSFPLGNDEPAREYAYSLNALNAAFGCFPSPDGSNAPDVMPALDGRPESGVGSLNHMPLLSSLDSLQDSTPNSAQFLLSQQQQQRKLLVLQQQKQQQRQQGIVAGPISGFQENLGALTQNVATSEAAHIQGPVEGMFGSKKAKTLLPIDYTPSSNSVILGRGRCSESIGNRRFKTVVQQHLQEYLDAPGKLEKTFVSGGMRQRSTSVAIGNDSNSSHFTLQIVSKVLNIIEQSCPVGAFVKYENGRWWSAGERASREKNRSKLQRCSAHLLQIKLEK